MSTYSKITRHPQTGQYESATWIDDYFGHHVYGVLFESDDKIYPTDIVNRAELKHFWAADVIKAVREFSNFDTDQDVLDFLDILNDVYKKRWEDDPLYGDGATMPEGE